MKRTHYDDFIRRQEAQLAKTLIDPKDFEVRDRPAAQRLSPAKINDYFLYINAIRNCISRTRERIRARTVENPGRILRLIADKKQKLLNVGKDCDVKLYVRGEDLLLELHSKYNSRRGKTVKGTAVLPLSWKPRQLAGDIVLSTALVESSEFGGIYRLEVMHVPSGDDRTVFAVIAAGDNVLHKVNGRLPASREALRDLCLENFSRRAGLCTSPVATTARCLL